MTWHIGVKQRSLVLVASCSFVLCLVMVVLACQIEAKLYCFRPVYAGVLLSIPSTSSLVLIIIFELNNAGTVCIIVESWLMVTTPDGTSNLQCNWEFLGVVYGQGRKLTSYGGDKKLWNWNTWSRKVLVADNCTVIFVCLSIILLGIVYLSINQSIIILIGIVYQPFNQSFNQFIHPSIHQIDCLFHTEKHIAFLWLNNMLLLAGAILKSISISIQKKVGNDDQTNTRTCGIKITCIIWLFHLRSSLFISWVFLHRKLCWIPPC